MRNQPDGYQAYLLRLWRVRSQGRWQWHAYIESPHTEDRQSFGTLAELLAFLKERTLQDTPRSGIGREEADCGSVPRAQEERHDV